MQNQRRKVSILLFLVLMLVLSGCSKGSAHVTVNRDGSVDIAAILRLDSRTQSLIGGKMDSLLSKLQAAGIQLEKNQDGSSTEYQYLKTYTSMELRSLMTDNKGSDFVDSNVKTTDKWFYKKIDVEAQLHLNSYTDKILQEIGTSTIPKSLIRLMMKSFGFDFSLTLPINLYGPNNATVQEGRTLTWHITLSDSEPIRMVIYVPNLKNIGISVGIGVLIAGGILIFWVRKRKKKKNSKV